MNLHNIAGPLVAAVNPPLIGQYQKSNGYTISADGTQVPAYFAAVTVVCQVQAIASADLVQIDGLNLNGEVRVIYCNGDFQEVSRPDAQGGDLITLPDSSIWLVVRVLENWYSMDGWTKFACVKQNGA